MMGAILTNKFM